MHGMWTRRAFGLPTKVLAAFVGMAAAAGARADEQTWLDANLDNLWSTGAAN